MVKYSPLILVLDGYRELITYDLVSRGGSGQECRGEYRGSDGTGRGKGYVESCIRSGTIKTSGDLPTTWYNYSLASAGTIKNTNATDYLSNTEKATESICPKGWTLPTATQINGNRDVSGFSPVLGGYYINGGLFNEDTYGCWWGSEANNGALRYYLSYNGSSLYTSLSGRSDGFYVRCVQKLADS